MTIVGPLGRWEIQPDGSATVTSDRRVIRIDPRVARQGREIPVECDVCHRMAVYTTFYTSAGDQGTGFLTECAFCGCKDSFFRPYE